MTDMHPDWERRFNAAPAPEKAFAGVDIPWSVYAWERAVMQRSYFASLPYFTINALAKEAPPATATYHRDSEGWSTLEGIKSSSAQSAIKAYATKHGHTIPQEVLDAWEFQAETDRLVMKVSDEARRIAGHAATGMRDEAELYRWVGNHLCDLAAEMGRDGE